MDVLLYASEVQWKHRMRRYYKNVSRFTTRYFHRNSVCSYGCMNEFVSSVRDVPTVLPLCIGYNSVLLLLFFLHIVYLHIPFDWLFGCRRAWCGVAIWQQPEEYSNSISAHTSMFYAGTYWACRNVFLHVHRLCRILSVDSRLHHQYPHR